MNYSALRKTLQAGSIVFGSSAILLVFLPSLFLDLLGLESSDALDWSMRMIGVTVIAIGGNLWNFASQIRQCLDIRFPYERINI